MAFLEFYAKYPTDEGRIVLTTPNAFSAFQFFWIIATRNRVWVNAEHACLQYLADDFFLELARPSARAET